jgi:hypothetical protein
MDNKHESFVCYALYHKSKKGKIFFPGPPIKAETEPADARTASDGLPVDCTIEFVAFSHQLKAVYYIGAQLTVDSSNQITGNEERRLKL